MNLKKYTSVLENSMSLFTLKVIDLALMIWLIPFFIIKVGMVNYGIYAFVMSLMLFFVNVLNYGFNLVTVREVAKNKHNSEKINHIFSEVFSVKIVLIFLIYVALIVLFFLVPKLANYEKLYFYSSFLIFGDFFSIRWFFMGIEKMKYITLINVFSRIIYVSLAIFLIKSKSDFIFIPLYEVVGMTSITVFSFLLALKHYKIKIKILSLPSIMLYLKKNFHSFLNLLLPSTYGITIVFLVGVLGSPIQVTYMEIGVKFSGVFSTVNNVLSTVFYPLVNRKQNIMISAHFTLLFLGAALSLIMFFSSDFIISKWLPNTSNDDSLHIINIIKILSLVPFLMAVISSYGVNGLLTYYKDVLFSKITLISTISMVLITIFTLNEIPFYSGALAFLVGRFIYASLSFYFFRKV